MKKVLKRKRFVDGEEAKQNTEETPKGVKIHEFKNSFEQWKKLFNRWITSNGEYFGGD